MLVSEPDVGKPPCVGSWHSGLDRACCSFQTKFVKFTKAARPAARPTGLRPSQIGLLSALRPWISAPCGSLVAGLADRWGSHRFMLLFTYVAVTLIQVGPICCLGELCLAALSMRLTTCCASSLHDTLQSRGCPLPSVLVMQLSYPLPPHRA